MRLRAEKPVGKAKITKKGKTMSSKPYTYRRFCGIDVAKKKHVACIIDDQGAFVARSQSFRNNADGYQRILKFLSKAGGPGKVQLGMEATGHYWFGLHDFLSRQGYGLVVLNPIQTAQQAKKGIRKRKTDKIDARHIAALLKNGEYKAALVPGELGMTCRQLTRLRYAMVKQCSQIKQRLWAYLHPAWPEYEAVFATPFCATGRRLLATTPTPADLLAMSPEELGELICKTSRGKYGPAQAEKVLQAATGSVGTQRGLEGARCCIRTLLSQLEAVMPVRKQLQADITALADRLPGYILTLPGADPLSAVSLFGETDPIDALSSSSQLVAFAGLDVSVFQTGQYTGAHHHISKRGSPFLRHTLWAMAHRAVQREGDLRHYWLRKRDQGLHHLAAVTATAVKLCHVAWRIMTDRRDYRPEGPPRSA